MFKQRHTLTALAALLLVGPASAEPLIDVRQPMTPPEWALLQREVLRAGSQAVKRFYDLYFDERGYLQHVARWGILDGTDDAIETFHNWTLFHALGADDLVLDRYRKALEGHFRQYTDVTLAIDELTSLFTLKATSATTPMSPPRPPTSPGTESITASSIATPTGYTPAKGCAPSSSRASRTRRTLGTPRVCGASPGCI